MMQMKEMIDDIVKNKVFGIVTSYFVVVEFQKRGLPHSHQSYTLADEDKPRTPEALDKIVTAEIPEKTKADEEMEVKGKNHKVIILALYNLDSIPYCFFSIKFCSNMVKQFKRSSRK